MKMEFTPAEFELIQFDEGADVIATSSQKISGSGESGTGNPFDEGGF